ncbi:histidine phosphatase family protein [Salinibacterium sp. SYSU T00001]|uniref:histidine phosphatase family protein n=1 Tax=Homoserinimonas sedimenticola TaxID=2986805 RepID=UPI0022368988|nr:histidine phosphatase family protein [Salinibacterium sedimenticola]MCW4384429.1 histidine phosphatase family protein [Salinibacterium sedimenticola]
MTRIGLIRHGETDWNREHRIQGRTDVPLNERGREQARWTAGALRSGTWDAVYTSPLSRAFETAQIIAEVLELPAPRPLDALTERNYGAAEGLTGAELDAAYPAGSSVPGRESRADAAARVIPSLHELARFHPGGSVLVVSHGGLIRSLLMAIEPAEGLHHSEPITNGSLHSIHHHDGVLSLVTFDEQLVAPGDEDITEQNAVEGREPSRA